METKANYVAVGAFVLACILGLVVALLWLAGAQYSEEFVYYQTYFTGPVTGLGNGTAVRYNGIDVGRVNKLDFDPDDPKKVVVTMQLNPELKLHEDSVASIASEGLTGGSYVEIDGGKKDTPLLQRQPGQKYAVIKSQPSTLQQLTQSAPALVAKLNRVGDKLNDLLSDENRKALSETLANLQVTTGVLAKRSANLDHALLNIDSASGQLKVALGDADKAFGKIDKLSSDADNVVNGDTAAQLSELVTQTRTLVTSLKRLSNELDRQPTKLLFGDRREGYTPK